MHNINFNTNIYNFYNSSENVKKLLKKYRQHRKLDCFIGMPVGPSTNSQMLKPNLAKG